MGKALLETPLVDIHAVCVESRLYHQALPGLPVVGRPGNALAIRMNWPGTVYWSSLLSQAIILVLGPNRF